MKYYNQRDQYKIGIDNKKHGMQLRQVTFQKPLTYPPGIMLEYYTKELKPIQFFNVFKNMETEQVKWNKHCQKCFVFDNEEDAIVTEMKLPWPLSPRIFMNFRYVWEYPDRDEYILIFSDKGHEKLWDQFTSREDISKFVVAGSVISAHWFRPIKDAQGRTVGTKLFYFNVSDPGSSAPAWLLNTFVPRAVQETFIELTGYIKNNK